MKQKKAVILVRPQMHENIGSAARAMKNFNIFNELRIVNPRDGWPSDVALRNATGGKDFIKNATIYNSLKEAIAEFEIVYATSARTRQMNKSYISAKKITADLPHNLNFAVIFGPENAGLNNEELSLANKIIYIDANPDFPSLNLAHTVMIICYELSKLQHNDSNYKNPQDIASRQEIMCMIDHMFQALEQKNHYEVIEKKKLMQRNIVNIFTRIPNFSKQEVQALRGIINKIN